MTETKKTRARTPKGASADAPKADLIELAAEPVAALSEIAPAEAAPAKKASVSTETKTKESEPFTFSLRDQGETIRQAVRETVVASAHGVLEVNDKIIQALSVQGHAALDLWRTAIDNSRQPDGFNAQTGAARQAFETASAHWKDVAETTARWMTKSAEPLQSAILRQAR
ncbi:phasin family protein [Microvirga sp. ACRRW]|uniref:phasin family protein n=1 Tax=Microvirga sp. ACRRW TaxID=2918205 RepID=UPI001EF4A754|nr:phasin family protein [Microvirga sp. ACRRW]MCG7392188.1 phasin family protein [Microvirga sp. ACRRW]